MQHRRVPGDEVASSLDRALKMAAGEAEVTPKGGKRNTFVIGGAAVFAEALPLVERLYLTRVHAEIPGDVYFPELDADAWRLVSGERHEIDERHAYPFSFEIWAGADTRSGPT